MGMRSSVLALAWGAAHALLSFTSMAIAQPETTPSYSLNAKGLIDVAEDGSVIDYQLEEELQKEVADAFGKSIMKWRFDPVLVEGKPARVRTRMFARLSGESTSTDRYAIRLIDVQFGSFATYESVAPVRYPVQALKSLMGARAIMVVLVDPGGNVTQVHTQQVNLYGNLKSSRRASELRDQFAEASAQSVREWKFAPKEPVPGAVDYSVVLVVDYKLGGNVRWSERLVPGPVVLAPWMTRSGVPVEDDYMATHVAGEGAQKPRPAPQPFLSDRRFKLQTDPIGSLL